MTPADAVGKQLSWLDGRDREAGPRETNPEVATWHPQLSCPGQVWEKGGAEEDSGRQVQCPALWRSYFLLFFCSRACAASFRAGQTCPAATRNIFPWERASFRVNLRQLQGLVMGEQEGMTSKILMLLIFFSPNLERRHGVGVQDEVGRGKCEPLTLFPGPVKALHTHESPGLVTGRIPSQRGGWSSSAIRAGSYLYLTRNFKWKPSEYVPMWMRECI